MSRYSLLDGETHEYGDLVLTVEFDVGRGSWIIGLTSPPLWAMGHNLTHGERVYSQVLMPVAAYENDETYEYLACLLGIHSSASAYSIRDGDCIDCIAIIF
jgi:hypothetical protein